MYSELGHLIEKNSTAEKNSTRWSSLQMTLNFSVVESRNESPKDLSEPGGWAVKW